MCRSFHCSVFILKILFFLQIKTVLFCSVGEHVSPMGVFRINLPAGSPDAPSYTTVSPGVKGKVVFRGQVKAVSGNNVLFNRVPDQLDPTVLSWPFTQGILATQKARAVAVLDSNQSISRIDVPHPGAGYSIAPKVSISLPTGGLEAWLDYEPAYATASVLNGGVASIVLDSNYTGSGYLSPPNVEIEGGVHFIRCVERGSMFFGKFFLISDNTGDTLTIDNPLNYDLSVVFSPNTMVEIFEGWTLGSLLGYSSTQLSDGNSSQADMVYLIKPEADQNGSAADYISFYHNGLAWERFGSLDPNASETIIYPDESFIIARKSTPSLDLNITGIANTENSFVQVPSHGKRSLMNNPFAIDVMLSDLIPSSNLTDDLNQTKKWLTSSRQEEADNIEVLHDGVWTTYWHDGTNKNVLKPAFLTARRGTGVAASMTQSDISMKSGVITAMTNPHTGNIEVTSPNHSLKRGFMIKISNAYGYKTNDDLPVKNLINEDGNVVGSTQDSVLIYSSANGFHEVARVTSPDTFELLGKSGDCMFEGNAEWITGNGGTGYESDAYVSFVGGGGQGAYGIARVLNGSVQSVIITQSGYGYTSAPKVYIHSGGWRRLGAGNSPFNDAIVPAGSGVRLTRNHQFGVATLLRITNPMLRN